VTLHTAGDQLYAAVYRTDTDQYLGPDGTWQFAPTWALTATDGDITQGGAAGVARPASYAGAVTFDNFYASAAPPASDRSSAHPPSTSGLPNGWAQWASSAQAGFQVVNTAPGASGGLMSTGDGLNTARAWATAAAPADVQVGADVYLNSLVPVRLFARGTG